MDEGRKRTRDALIKGLERAALIALGGISSSSMAVSDKAAAQATLALLRARQILIDEDAEEE